MSVITIAFLNLVMSLILLVAFFVAVSRLGAMVTALQRLGTIVTLLRELNNSWGEFRDSGFGGQIPQERLESLLPESMTCLACGEEVDLSFGQRLFRRFKCPECGVPNDLNDSLA